MRFQTLWAAWAAPAMLAGLAACGGATPAKDVSAAAMPPVASTPAVVNSAAGNCAALPPLPAVPPGAKRVTDYGAVPDDNLPDDAAIDRALADLSPGQWLVFPPGRYIQARSIYVRTRNVTLWGAGAVLHASNPADHTLGLRAPGAKVYGFELTAVTDVRRSTAEQSRVSIYREASLGEPLTGNVVRGLTITQGTTASSAHSAGSAGILVVRASHFTIAENTVRRSLADGIHITGGSSHGRIVGNTVRETGDDMIAMVTYLGKGWQDRLHNDSAWRNSLEQPGFFVSNIAVLGNDVADNYWGRGIAVVGSRDITIADNRIRGTPYTAAVLVAQEGGYGTPGPRNVLISGNHIARVQNTTPPFVPAGWKAPPPTGHGAVEIHAIQNAAGDLAKPLVFDLLSLRGVAVQGNRVEQVAADGVRMGADTAPGLISDVLWADNRFAQVGGSALRNLMPHTGSARCRGNTLNGQPVSGACRLAADPVVTGANLNCAALPS